MSCRRLSVVSHDQGCYCWTSVGDGELYPVLWVRRLAVPSDNVSQNGFFFVVLAGHLILVVQVDGVTSLGWCLCRAKVPI